MQAAARSRASRLEMNRELRDERISIWYVAWTAGQQMPVDPLFWNDAGVTLECRVESVTSAS